MSATIEVIEPGLLTTVQDLGRRGFQRFGIPVCGALDTASLRIANILVGNPESCAGLEMTGIGPVVRFGLDMQIAITGADFSPTLDGADVPSWESVSAPAGSSLRFGTPDDGVRAYLAIAGGVDVPLVTNSRSTDLKGGFGGFEGRALQVGDVLPVDSPSYEAGPSPKRLPITISRQPTRDQSFQIRVVLGPQDAAFTESGISMLLTSEYAVSMNSDRTGCRLEGPAVEHLGGPDIVSDGTALGSIQIPGNGMPIVLLADRGTTGGYTKVATVISPDIGLLAQAMPGATLRFAAVSVDEAHDAFREQEDLIREIKSYVGLDMAGTFAIHSEDSAVEVRGMDGGPISLPGVSVSRGSTRKVTAKVGGEEFEFELGISSV